MTAAQANACDSCQCTLARSNMDHGGPSNNWFFDVNIEHQNWDRIDPTVGHQLHHQNHHVHDKTHETLYHFSLGASPAERWTLLAELPYVERHALEIDDHAIIGQKQTSEGLGDLSLTATYRFHEAPQGFLGAIFGVKLPTGETHELNSVGTRFEPEMQPGTGSFDFPLGAAYQAPLGSWHVHGTATWTVKTRGDQDFEFGDVVSFYNVFDTPFGGRVLGADLHLGVDTNLQIEKKQRQSGRKVADSGGTTFLVGPSLDLEFAPRMSIFANLLFPAYQDRGGVHQETDFITHVGVKAAW